MNLYEIYLCSRDLNNNYYICNKFDNFDQAIKFFRQKNKFISINEFENTMVPICKFNPFKKSVLRYKLQKVFKNPYLSINDIKFK